MTVALFYQMRSRSRPRIDMVSRIWADSSFPNMLISRLTDVSVVGTIRAIKRKRDYNLVELHIQLSTHLFLSP